MAVNSVRVSSKVRPPRRRAALVPRRLLWIFAGLFVLCLAATPFGYDYYSGKLGIIGPQPIVTETAAGKIIKVPPGGNLQGALELANGGDIIELQAGAVYTGTISLPNKRLTEYVTIRSSAAADLPPNKRVSPAQRSSMATIVAGMLGRPAVRAVNGANHYRFVGIEFTTTSSLFNYGLVELGRSEDAANLPHDIEIDRCYIHPSKTGSTRRGIALNSADTVVKNSYIAGFGFAGEETQGIGGWTGTRKVQILNNYIEGGAENILFGGADPATPDLIPTDIEIRGNHLNKPAEWQNGVTVKTLFELKNAKRVQFVGNLLTNNWEGSAFRITVRNQDEAAPFSTIEDVLIANNIIDGAGAGINILGKDDIHPSQTLKRLNIENNLFLNVADGGNFKGSGYFIQVSDGEDITISNNTSFNGGNIATFHGVLPRRLVVRDNIINHGSYGIHGPIDLKSDTARSMFVNNVIINQEKVEPSGLAFPAGNMLVNSIAEVGFVNASVKDFRLSPESKFKGKGTAKADIGWMPKGGDDPSLLAQ